MILQEICKFCPDIEFIHIIKITHEGVSKEKKAKFVAGAKELLASVLGKNPATTIVVIDEVETDNWGISGELVAERRKRGI